MQPKKGKSKQAAAIAIKTAKKPMLMNSEQNKQRRTESRRAKALGRMC